jgi:uncharacterized protein (DUF1499 family)
MKKLFSVPLAIVAVVVVLSGIMLVRCSILGHSSKSGAAPGLVAGALSSCPDKPNCVCSEFGEDAAHYIEPFDYSGIPSEKAWGEILRVVEELGGQVVVANDEYIAATFSSFLFGFTDDVECRLDGSEERIQIRSASRVGYGDLGVNRRRVEAMARSFNRGRGIAAED